MQITIDTNQLSEQDAQILRLLVGSDAPAPAPAKAEPEATPAAAPAKRFTAADFEAVPGVGDVTAQRIVEHLYGTAEAPETEEADTEEASAPEEEVVPETDAEDAEDGPTMSDAVAAATKLVSAGKAAQVKAALAEVGAKRVSEMDEGDIPAFMTALEA